MLLFLAYRRRAQARFDQTEGASSVCVEALSNGTGESKLRAREFLYRYHLLPSDVKPLHYFLDGGSRFKV